jgi:sugar lactone lactonase YvrE
VFINVSAQTEEAIKSDKLTLKWSTGKIFEVPESVCFDEKRNVLYVSNINGKPTDKDGNGYISTISTSGDMITPKWVTGLNAPKGMGVYKDKLFVTDIDRLVEIDIPSGKIVADYPVEDAKFLNDIAIDKKGRVYVSDMMDTKIYRLMAGEFKVWLDDEMLTSPNGLWTDDEYLYIGCKKIVKADLKSGDMELVNDETGSIDGLEGTNKGGFLFSDWSGNIHYMSPDNKIEHLFNSAEMNINAADIEFIGNKNLILVPTFFDNRVMAYEFVE